MDSYGTGPFTTHLLGRGWSPPTSLKLSHKGDPSPYTMYKSSRYRVCKAWSRDFKTVVPEHLAAATQVSFAMTLRLARLAEYTEDDFALAHDLMALFAAHRHAAVPRADVPRGNSVARPRQTASQPSKRMAEDEVRESWNGLMLIDVDFACRVAQRIAEQTDRNPMHSSTNQYIRLHAIADEKEIMAGELDDMFSEQRALREKAGKIYLIDKLNDRVTTLTHYWQTKKSSFAGCVSSTSMTTTSRSPCTSCAWIERCSRWRLWMRHSCCRRSRP